MDLGAGGPASGSGGVSRGFGLAAEDVGRLSRRGAQSPAPGPRASHAHRVLLSFRTSSVKDSSFVEKMKKTVSFLHVCALPRGVVALVDEGGRPAPLDRRGERARTFSANQSPKLLCPAQKAYPLFRMFTS